MPLLSLVFSVVLILVGVTIESESFRPPSPSRRLLSLKKEAIPPEVNLLAGMVAGSVGVGVAYPIDTLKVKTQTFLDTAAAGEKAPSPWSLAATVVKNEGVGAFYSGVSTTMFGQALIKGSVFWAYGAAQRSLELDLGVVELSAWWTFLAACLSGAFGSFLVTPFERIKCVMQAAGSNEFSSPLSCIRDVVESDGVAGLLFRGIGATLLRETPSYGLYFFAYELTKGALLEQISVDPNLAANSVFFNQLVPLVGGAAAGVASWVPVYPIDVVKTNLQFSVDGGRRETLVSATQRIYSTGGPGAFWDGLGPKLARAVVNHATTFLVFEQIVQFCARIPE
mmetsp:Transcript_50730/g.86917  ORF Transcript_50730/g.86917 Transcript_50730/m.86917 type:complete len:338 (-) Transcript_50730:251-1264(-)